MNHWIVVIVNYNSILLSIANGEPPRVNALPEVFCRWSPVITKLNEEALGDTLSLAPFLNQLGDLSLSFVSEDQKSANNAENGHYYGHNGPDGNLHCIGKVQPPHESWRYHKCSGEQHKWVQWRSCVSAYGIYFIE